MIREKVLLKLLSGEIRSLHASAIALEKDMHRLSLEIESHNIDSLTGIIAQINCSGFAPIETMLSEAGVASAGSHPHPILNGVLAEVGVSARRAETQRLGTASAISIMRRAARYMELHCSSIAESATRLRLDALADHLRAWAREWIGLELNLNAVAAGPRLRESALAA